MHTNPTQVVGFARELSEDKEWFTAKWLAEGPPPAHVELYFASATRLKAWLVTEQFYSEDQADALVMQLRASADTPP